MSVLVGLVESRLALWIDQVFTSAEHTHVRAVHGLMGNCPPTTGNTSRKPKGAPGKNMVVGLGRPLMRRLADCKDHMWILFH